MHLKELALGSAKAIATTLTALSAWIATAPTDGITPTEWGTFVGCFIAGFVVWLVPNKSES